MHNASFNIMKYMYLQKRKLNDTHNKRPMGHIAHLFKSLNTYDYHNVD